MSESLSPIPFLSEYDSQSVFTYTNNGNTNATISFNVVYRSPTTYKVIVTENLNASYFIQTFTAWVLRNGTTLAVDESEGGRSLNVTGSQANGLVGLVIGAFDPVIEGGGLGSSISNDTQYFHATGTAAVDIGGEQVTVTNYTTNSPDEVVTGCSGSTTYAAFSVSIGTPSGTTFPIITYLEYSVVPTPGEPSSFAYTENWQLMSFTLAQ